MNSKQLALLVLGLACLVGLGHAISCYTCSGCSTSSSVSTTTCDSGYYCQVYLYKYTSGSNMWYGQCISSSSAQNGSYSAGGFYGIGYSYSYYYCTTDLCNTFST